jgi:hypothetical protein
MADKTGGSAFPVIMMDSDRIPYSRDPGMELRDWFAGQCFNSYASWALTQPVGDLRNGEEAAAKYARIAYQMADALIAERDK